MRLNKWIKNFMNDNTGASLLYVLGIMFFILAISSSMLIAASTNKGVETSQIESSQILMLDDSIHRTIMWSLQQGTTGTLGVALLEILYNSYNPGDFFQIVPDIIIDSADINFSTTHTNYDNNVSIESITLSFPPQELAISVRGAVLHGELEIATVNAIMVVEVEINAVNNITDTAIARTISSRATYRYTNGRIEGGDTDNPINPGVWELLKREIAN